LNQRGQVVRDRKILERIRTLAIPPAWEEVWICRDPRGHLQATGRDVRGRKQFRYHNDWRQVRDEATFAGPRSPGPCRESGGRWRPISRAAA